MTTEATTQQETGQQPTQQETEATTTTQQETTTYKATQQEKNNIASPADFAKQCKKADEVVDEIGISGMDDICDIVCDTMKDILKKIPEKLTEVSEDEFLHSNGSKSKDKFEEFIKSTNLLKNGKKDRTITEMKNNSKYHNSLDSIKGMEHYEEDTDEETKEIKKNINDVQNSISSIKTDIRIICALFAIFSAYMVFFH